MTENEAKKKWCPMYRIVIFGTESVDNRGNDEAREGGNMNCIASDCMIWRWTISPDDVAQVAALQNYQEKENGYCGLAGKDGAV